MQAPCPAQHPFDLDRLLVSIELAGDTRFPTVRVDAPNNALRENLMLVQGNQGPECRRGELWEDDAITRAIALEDFALDQRLGRIRAHFLANLFLSLAEGERLGLGEVIGK